MGSIKAHVKTAITLAITLFILNLIIGAIEYFAKLGSGQIAKYIYNPFDSFVGK